MASPMLWGSWKQTVVRLGATTETAFSQLPAYKPSSILSEKKGFCFAADSSMKMSSQELETPPPKMYLQIRNHI